jgi:hypothetical protein
MASVCHTAECIAWVVRVIRNLVEEAFNINMPPRKWKQEHTNFCATKFTTVRNKPGRWFVDKGSNTPVTTPTLKEWFKEVENIRILNPDSIWHTIDYPTFKRNVTNAVAKFVIGPRDDVDDDDDDSDATRNGSETAGTNNPNNATGRSKESAAFNVDEDDDDVASIISASYSEGTLESAKSFGDSISLAYTQCVYGISHKDNVLTATSKCHIIIQPVSGWSIREESAKGDFIQLTSNGTKLVLKIRANTVLFDFRTARSILIDSGLFNDVYEDSRSGSTHPAVSSMGVAMSKATMTPVGAIEIPSHTLTIPLLASFKSVCAVEGLDTDPVPQVSFINILCP